MPTTTSMDAYKQVLATCSPERLRAFYLDNKQMVKEGLRMKRLPTRLVTDADIEKDPQAARRKMEVHLGGWAVEKLPQTFRKKLMLQLKGMGGVKITAVEGKGMKAFVYTTGFTAIGGKELLLQNVHRSMFNGMNVAHIFNWLFQRHKEGHPLAHGHTVAGNGLAFAIFAPDNDVEATFLKASKTLESTRLYGLTGYDLLLIVPVGASQDMDKQASRTEALMMATGFEVPGYNSALSLQTSPHKQVKMCGWGECHKTVTDTGLPLMRCSNCKSGYYCSLEHQKLDWKHHKKLCLASKNEMIEKFGGEEFVDVAEAVKSLRKNVKGKNNKKK